MAPMSERSPPAAFISAAAGGDWRAGVGARRGGGARRGLRVGVRARVGGRAVVRAGGLDDLGARADGAQLLLGVRGHLEGDAARLYLADQLGGREAGYLYRGDEPPPAHR